MGTLEQNQEISTFAEQLRTDRMIKTTVGDALKEGHQPYLVQQSLLENAADYFKNALKPDAFREGENGHLHFPDDHREAWEVLLYWLFHKDIPILTQDQRTLVRCWCLGDKYGIARFQDHILWFLLIHFCRKILILGVVKEGFECSPPYSKLRTLLTKETAMQCAQGYVGYDDFDSLEGLGFGGEFIKTYDQWHEDNEEDRLEPLIHGDDAKIRDTWKEFMVGEMPKFPFSYESSWSTVKEIE